MYVKQLVKKGLVVCTIIFFIGMSFTPIINGNKWINDSISQNNTNYEENIVNFLPRETSCETKNRYQKYFGSYPSDYSFVWFYNPPRELEWEYNKESFNGTINKFYLLATDNTNHSWDLSRLELHINGINCSYPDIQSFYRKHGAWYQWEIIWNNLSQFCSGEILFEIIFLDFLWIQYAGDLDNDGDATFHYSCSSPYSYLNGILDGEHIYDCDKAYIVSYTPANYNPPDMPTKPSGNTSGYTCIDYNYSTSTTDPFGLNVSYGWDWNSDLVVDEWTDWYESNETCEISHNWTIPDVYSISVKAKNLNEEESNWSSSLNVTILSNPPYPPSNPNPCNGTLNMSICPLNLSWNGGDPDGDTLTYDVYFGDNPENMKQVKWNQTNNYTYRLNLDFNTIYYWKIVAWDIHGVSTKGPIWSFSTEENLPPCPPTQPFPEDGAPYIPIENVTLCWVGCDPNECDMLRYDVFFDDVNPPLVKRVSEGYENCTELPFTLTKYKTYYWRVDTYDKSDLFTEGNVWRFTTGDNHPPSEPIINGPTHGKVGVEYTYTFNTTDADGHWLKYYVDWGDGTKDITDLVPNGTVVTLTHTWHTKGTYNIRVKAIDVHGADSNWGNLTVTIPRDKVFSNFMFLLRIFERFPLFERLLDVWKGI